MFIFFVLMPIGSMSNSGGVLKVLKSRSPASHEGAVRPEDVWVALAVHVLRVALDAVAAVDLR